MIISGIPFRKTKQLILLSMFFVLIFQDILAAYFTLCKYIDELFSVGIFLAGSYAWKSRWKDRLKYSSLLFISGLVIFNICGWLSSYVAGYRDLKITMLSFFLANKFFITMLGIMGMCLYTNFRKDLYSMLFVVRPTLVMLALWQMASYIFPQIIIPVSVLELCAKTVFLIALIFLDWRKSKDYFYVLLAILLLMSTGRAKAYGAIVIILAIIIWILKMKKKVRFPEIVLGVSGIILLVWQKIYGYYIFGMEAGYPRAMLMKYGAILAIERFPFGTGWGTFGSHYAAQFYSPVYVELGWSDLHDVGRQAAGYLNDTYWPTVCAETGFIGLLGFLIVLFYAFWRIQKQFRIDKKVYAAGFLSWTYMMITTLESTAFAHPAVLVLAIVWGLTVTNKAVDAVEPRVKV